MKKGAKTDMSEKGTISIHAQNIMPIIKRWLYSDKDIFLRELISNGCDAISKYKLLALSGEAIAREDYRIDVVIDKDAGTLTITDNGIGMTADEVQKYIAQVAFSGAEEFLAQYKKDDPQDVGIIGHFGLGFYSAFMVSSKVTIDTLSYKKDAEAVRWTSEDGMEYEMEPSSREIQGTAITLSIMPDESEFLEYATVIDTLNKYCAFMPVPIFLSDKEKPDDDPKQINETKPLWMRKPSECTDEDYKQFYQKVFMDFEEPLFWIHLNAEYPFNLKGILYFPRLKQDFSPNEGKIKLYNNQVFVADNIKEVIPEFLMLLKGVIDCPDLPLNVSRSFLQNDGYVKKMNSYITRKVADRLISEFTNKREDYQKYWSDIHMFVKYGCIRDEKFYERVKPALLFETTEGDYLTLDEAIEKAGEDKTLYYTSDPDRQAQMIDLFKQQGKPVLILGAMIDNNFISFLEYKEPDGVKFKRVDAAADALSDSTETDEGRRAALETRVRAALSDDTIDVKLESLKADDLPAMITVDEQSRRFSEMSKYMQGGFSMPEKRTLILNTKSPITQYLEQSQDTDRANALICQLMDLAEMARQPLSGERMVGFLKRSNELLLSAIDK